MAQLNANIPYIEAYVKNSYLYENFLNIELTKCYIFGVKAIINKPLLFHCQLENGVVWWSLPLSAFVWKPDFDWLSIDEIIEWFEYDMYRRFRREVDEMHKRFKSGFYDKVKSRK